MLSSLGYDWVMNRNLVVGGLLVISLLVLLSIGLKQRSSDTIDQAEPRVEELPGAGEADGLNGGAPLQLGVPAPGVDPSTVEEMVVSSGEPATEEEKIEGGFLDDSRR